MATMKIDKKKRKSQSSSEESSNSESDRETQRQPSISRPHKSVTKRKRSASPDHSRSKKRRKSSRSDSSSDESASDSASDGGRNASGAARKATRSRSGSESGSSSSSASQSSSDASDDESKAKATRKANGHVNDDNPSSESSASPTPKPYVPPSGFEKVPKSNSKTNTVADLLDPAKLAADGKELWYISAPASLPFQSIKHAYLDKPKKGHVSVTHDGVEYIMRAEEGRIDPHLMTTSDAGASYKVGMWSDTSLLCIDFFGRGRLLIYLLQ